jgi:PAS domain S-box-containing protein
MTATVLILDDRGVDRELLSTVLGYAGYKTLEASSGAVALELAQAKQPNLIITDIVMPDMDGYGFVRALRSDERINGIPVVFCTATYNSTEVDQLAAASGVSHILSKPCEPEEIIRVVAEALDSDRELVAQFEPDMFDAERLSVVNRKLIENVQELETANQELEQLQAELRESQRQTAESLTLLETIQAAAPIGIGFVDREFRVVRMNAPLAAIMGLPVELQLGRTLPEVVPDIWPRAEAIYRHVLETGEAVVNREVRGEVLSAGGEPRLLLVSHYPVRLEAEVIGVGVVVADITERRQAESFRSAVVQNMAEGLCVLDSDDRLLLLNQAAVRLLGYGEDELRGRLFHAAIGEPASARRPTSERDSAIQRARAEQAQITVAEDVFVRKDGTLLPVAYSVSPLEVASGGTGLVVVFRDATDERNERERVKRELDSLTWVGRTRDALEEGRLILYSQPIVPLGTGEPSEELLIRIIDRDGTVVPPGTFLPVAEKYGLIAEIDRWVAIRAIELVASGRRMQANLSAESIGNVELLTTIRDELSRSGGDPSKLTFEITETGLIRDGQQGEDFAHALVELGCSLALDDFGTGFASLTYLKRLPISFIKIDIDFVRALPSSTANQHLVRAIVNLAQGFGQRTIAEGVEDERTLELLREYDVDFAQGFHLGRPAPLITETAPTTSSGGRG